MFYSIQSASTYLKLSSLSYTQSNVTLSIINQELLERNRILDERAASLEYQTQSSNDLITQLRHELVIKSDLLRVSSAINANRLNHHRALQKKEMLNYSIASPLQKARSFQQSFVQKL